MKALSHRVNAVLLVLNSLLFVTLLCVFAFVPGSRYLSAMREANSVGLTPFVKAYPFEVFVSRTNSWRSSYVFRNAALPHGVVFERHGDTNEVRFLLGWEWSFAATYLSCTNHITVLTTSVTTPDIVCIDTNMDCIYDFRHSLSRGLGESGVGPGNNHPDETAAP